jgi:hypothetical protein
MAMERFSFVFRTRTHINYARPVWSIDGLSNCHSAAILNITTSDEVSERTVAIDYAAWAWRAVHHFFRSFVIHLIKIGSWKSWPGRDLGPPAFGGTVEGAAWLMYQLKISLCYNLIIAGLSIIYLFMLKNFPETKTKKWRRIRAAYKWGRRTCRGSY